MTILVIEHHDSPSLGVVGEAIEAAGVPTKVLWGEDGDPMPDSSDDYDGMVVLGGAMNALDDSKCPYFPQLVRLIQDFGVADKPVLGICLGSQLIARAYDAPVHLEGPFEFGFCPIKLTEDGASDPVVGHMKPDQGLFEWHTDHYALPDDAVHLASGTDYTYQCFRMGRATYAMQFHFEVTREIVDGWIEMTGDFCDQNVPDYRNWLPKQFEDHMDASKEFCRSAIRNWLALV
ncbi:MAG: type 1 glutamine amidotransferase [Rhodospirillales bacterium]|nr:type 1 glutamine amidotransferase [Rhodospirillales bacterium]